MDNVTSEIHDGIALVTITRPKALNAINEDVLNELNVVFDELGKNPDLRAVILTGDGEKAFVAGADIKGFQGKSPKEAKAFAEKGQNVFRKIETFKVPVIAAVNGFALGGGFELALSCDFIVASSNANFGLPEVQLGIMPGFGGTQRLARVAGPTLAKEMTFTGKHYSADELLGTGIVNYVVEQSELLDLAKTFCMQIASKGPLGISRAKQAINEGLQVDIDKGMEIEAEIFGDLFETKDAAEGIAAFVEKRTPEFKGE